MWLFIWHLLGRRYRRGVHGDLVTGLGIDDLLNFSPIMKARWLECLWQVFHWKNWVEISNHLLCLLSASVNPGYRLLAITQTRS